MSAGVAIFLQTYSITPLWQQVFIFRSGYGNLKFV